jgi:tetratricopeptide (TPR) repeat protein
MQVRIRRTRHAAAEPGLPLQGRSLSGRSQPMSNAEAIAQAAESAQAGDLTRALSILAARLAQDPDDPELLYARALTLSDWGRLRESLDSLHAAETRGLTSLGLQLNAAQICYRLGLTEEAEHRANRAVSLDSTSARAHLCLATVLQATGRYAAAERSYERALQYSPEAIEYLAYIATCRLDQMDDLGAEAVARRAISQEGDQAMSWNILGIALSRQDRRGEALAAFERAEEIETRTGQTVGTFRGHGLALIDFGRISEALELYQRHLPRQPDPLAQGHYGFALLTAGRYREGWEQYEFRRFQEPLLSARLPFDRPEWNDQCLQGKTLLVWTEQGIGDVIQFARFGQQLKSQGATVVLQVREQLKELAPYFAGFDRVVVAPQGARIPFDYHISAMSLPRVLCPDVASIPTAVPYLRTDPTRVQHWREALGKGARLKVGVVWAGNPQHRRDRQRSVGLSELKPLWGIEGIDYFSLQKEQRDEDATYLSSNSRLIDLAPQLHDFRDTAAAIEALDLVIAVDTAVAHVAGALGKPVWLLLPAAADFRWLMDREDSPWYPTMRLFRQQQPGEWQEVIGRVADALRVALDRQRAGKLLDTLLPARTTSAARDPSMRCDDPSAEPRGLSRVVETRYGIMQYLPRKNDIARSIELYGEWLQAHVNLIGKLSRPGSTILEAPSGIGAHVLALARLNGPDGHLLAYEADPLLKSMLFQNVRANRFESVVTVMRRQLAGATASEEHGLSVSGTDGDERGRQLDVETIDDLRLARLDLIKINECGHARSLFEGASESLWRLRPSLLLTVANAATLETLADQVRSFGYRCWRMESKLFEQGNFNACPTDVFPQQRTVAIVGIPEESEIELASEECVELGS